MMQCQAALKDLAAYAVENFDSSDRSSGLFYAADADNILEYRAGYYLGLKAIQQVAVSQNLTPQALINCDYTDLKRRTFEALKNISAAS